MTARDRAAAIEEAESEHDSMLDTAEARRRRAKKRRSFFKTLVGADSSGAEGATSDSSAVSFMSEASFSSSFGDWDSSNPYSTSAPTTPTRSTSSLFGTETSGQSSDEDPEDREDVVQRQRTALENVTLYKKKGRSLWDEDYHRNLLSRTLGNAFGVFSLGVLLADDNRFTPSDLAFWARSGALSYADAALHVPRLLVLTGVDSLVRDEQQPPSWTDLVSRAYQMAGLLNLWDVEFCPGGGENRFRVFVGRCLKELALPRELESHIVRAFAHTDLLRVNAKIQPGMRKCEVIDMLHKAKQFPTTDVRYATIPSWLGSTCSYDLCNISEPSV